AIARVLAREARRAHPRPPAERVDLEPGIIRERRQLRALRGVARLQERVREQGRAGLGQGGDAERALRDERERQRREQRRQLAELPGVAAGENDARHGPLSAWACSANSSPMPCAARFSSASSSWRRNAWPSAVPWIWRNAPQLYMTPFMPVSAWGFSAWSGSATGRPATMPPDTPATCPA